MPNDQINFKNNAGSGNINSGFLTSRNFSTVSPLKSSENVNSLAKTDMVIVPEQRVINTNPFLFKPKFDIRVNTIPQITKDISAIKIEKPDFIKSTGTFFVSMVKVVDPNEPLKTAVAQMFRSKQNSVNLTSAYTFDGVFSENKLKADLLGLLQSNKSVPNGKLEETAGIMARQARITSINRVNLPESAVNSKLPTRPIDIEATPFPQKDINVDGMRLRYIDVGPENPKGTILFIHGHQSSLEEFNLLVPELSKEYRCLAVDLPGSGYSDQPDINYSLELYEKTLLHFMDNLGVDKATVAGGSLGGNMSLRLGRLAPDRFPNVVSWSPAGVWKPKKFMATMAKTDLLIGPLYWPMLKVQSKEWYKDGFPGKQEIIYDSMKFRREVDSVQFHRSTGQIASQQLRDTHRGLGYLNKQPTLLMVGRDDTGLALGKNAIEFSKEIPNVELKIFENTGHSIHGERPNELIKQMKDFLNNHPVNN
jgi:pimeloyl-ACP methyl ester carboxylesterase